jgi:rod shape-determining protein MreC
VYDKQIRRRRAVLALLVVVSLILLTDYFGESSSSPLHSVQRGIATVLSPVQEGASTVLSPVRDVAGWFSSTFRAKSQLAQRTAENHTLRLDDARLQYEVTQYKKYARLLKLDRSYNLHAYGLVAANVIAKDPVLWYETITVDKGSGDGVRQWDPVVGPGGLVGRVSQVYSDAAIVSLLTSPDFAVGAEVENSTGSAGLIQPEAGNPSTLQLINLPTTAPQVGTGQVVVTSGYKDSGNSAIHSFAPAGIPIGTISSENPQSSLLTNQPLQVTPFADLPDLSAVQILTHPGRGL